MYIRKEKEREVCEERRKAVVMGCWW